MKLLEQMQADMVEAMKAKDAQKVSILKLAISEVKTAEAAQGKDFSDEEAQKMLRTFVKKLNEAVEEMQSVGQTDNVEQEKRNIEIIEAYLPAQMSEADIEKAVDEVIAQTNPSGMQDMGRVMGMVMGKLQGQADGGKVQEIVKNKLS